jgi:hypothetical protein
VKNEWEQMAYSKMSNVYNNHQIAPTTKSVNALLAAAKTYLQHHDKRGDTATETLRLAQWHLNMEPHPLTLYIDQEKKLYVKVIYNGAVYTETKNTGRSASVSLPQHKSTDTVWIESYQDDRFDDTNLKKNVQVNSLKGNHHLKIEDQRGNIVIQAIFKDFPGLPQFATP